MLQAVVKVIQGESAAKSPAKAKWKPAKAKYVPAFRSGGIYVPVPSTYQIFTRLCYIIDIVE